MMKKVFVKQQIRSVPEMVFVCEEDTLLVNRSF